MYLVSKYGKSPTDSQNVEIQRRRQDLSRRFTRHMEDTGLLFPGVDDSTQFGLTHIREPCSCREDEVCGHMGQDIDPFMFPSSASVPGPTPKSGSVERLEVPLPSSAFFPKVFDSDTCFKELQLRKAQADEALQGIRREVGYKSFLFKANKKLLHTKEMRTRGYKVVADADQEIRRHVRLYNLARASIQRLSTDRLDFSRYKEVQKVDLKPLPSIYGPNDAGGSRVKISWIWTVQLGVSEPADSPYMIESEPLVYSTLCH
jgi:hypothetical protein